MKAQYFICLGIALISTGLTVRVDGNTRNDFAAVDEAQTLIPPPRASTPNESAAKELRMLEAVLELQEINYGKYGEELADSIRSIRGRYEQLRKKWLTTVGEVDIRRSPMRRRAMAAQTIAQKPIQPSLSWVDFENDNEFEEISADGTTILPKVTTTSKPTTQTSTERIDRLLELEKSMVKIMREQQQQLASMRTSPTTQTASTTRSTTSTTPTTTPTTTSTTTTTTTTSTTPEPSTAPPTTTASTTVISTTQSTTILMTAGPTTERTTASVPAALLPHTVQISDQQPAIIAPAPFVVPTNRALLQGTRPSTLPQFPVDRNSIQAEIGALMELWERGPLAERLKSADDNRIERLLKQKDLEQFDREILLGKRALRRLLILSRLFEDRDRILQLIVAQKNELKKMAKQRQRVPKHTDRQQNRPNRRQVSRLRAQQSQPERPHAQPHARQAFQPTGFDPSTDTLDTAIERGFVETDPEFVTRRPGRTNPRLRLGARQQPLFARLHPVQGQRSIDEKKVKIVSLRGRNNRQDKSIEDHPEATSQAPKSHDKTRSESHERKSHKTREISSADSMVESLQNDDKKRIQNNGKVLETCTQMECDFEKGDLCNWESSADELSALAVRRRAKREESFAIRSWSNVEGFPTDEKTMKRNEVFSATNTKFAAVYVGQNEVATLSAKVPHEMPVGIRFLAWEATREVRLRLCCDDFCPFSTEAGVKRGHRRWLAHTVRCPANTKMVTFECVNTGPYNGTCGVDSVYFAHPVCPDLLPYEEDEE